MINIRIEWQGLITENGETCDRCNQTFLNLEKVISVLKPAFEKLGIEINLDRKALSYDKFRKNPLVSNQIIIDGNPIESILNLGIGQSRCCGPCAGYDCRTLIFQNAEKEVVEERIILKAILESLIRKL